MKFVSAEEMVGDAHEGGYGVPALNTNGGTYDIARAALEASQELAAPLILQVYEPNCEYRGFRQFVNLARFLCDELEVTIPVALQLDHGHSLASVVEAMRAGMTSVMFDASHEPLEENIARTREVIAAAQELGVSVEAEVGYVKGNEPTATPPIGRAPVPEAPAAAPAKTSVDEALAFVSRVEVDMLAVSVGTTHGVYRRQTGIDYDLLKELRSKISVPLVQHGTSGISAEELTRLTRAGMAKVNFGEPFRYNYINTFNELTDTLAHQWHAWRIMREVKDRLKEDMETLIRACGADGKAG